MRRKDFVSKVTKQIGYEFRFSISFRLAICISQTCTASALFVPFSAEWERRSSR